jgi:HEAT repeat protein
VSRSVDGLIDKCLRLINPPVDRAVRRVAIDALGLIGGGKAIDALRGLLTGPDGEAAALALAGSADPAGPEALRNFLTDFAIGGDQNPSQQDTLAFAQRNHARYVVALVLSALGDPESIEVLCDIVTNPHEDLAIRRMAARELRYCGPRAIEPLRAVVDQEGGVSRRSAKTSSWQSPLSADQMQGRSSAGYTPTPTPRLPPLPRLPKVTASPNRPTPTSQPIPPRRTPTHRQVNRPPSSNSCA